MLQLWFTSLDGIQSILSVLDPSVSGLIELTKVQLPQMEAKTVFLINIEQTGTNIKIRAAKK